MRERERERERDKERVRERERELGSYKTELCLAKAMDIKAVNHKWLEDW